MALVRPRDLMLLISDMFACHAYFCLMLAQKSQPRLTGAIITSVTLALLSHRRTISHRLRWAVLGAGTVWFDAKDIQSVASNYMGPDACTRHRRGRERGGWQALLQVYGALAHRPRASLPSHCCYVHVLAVCVCLAHGLM